MTHIVPIMRVVIVDDERLARLKLAGLLGQIPGVEIVGECSNGVEALTLVEEKVPDVILLDIEMPEMNGFEFLEKLPPPHPPIVFTTAFSEFAVKAFEFNALDYLTKPIEMDRLRAALEKCARQLEQQHAAMATERTGDGEPRYLGSLDKVFVREGDQCWFVQIGQIRLLESQGSYTRISFGEHSPLIYRSLNYLEPRLNPSGFFRANRSQIINLKMIEKVEPWFSGNLRVTLQGGLQVELSRRQAKVFRDKYSL